MCVKDIAEKRQQAMVREHTRRETLQQKTNKKGINFLNIIIIATSEELRHALVAIDLENLSAQKKKAKKLSILKVQINIRKKMLKQSIRIPFSAARKSWPVNEIFEELEHFIDNNPLPDIDPLSMVGRHIRHKFVAEGDTEWYDGIILDYDSSEKKHLIQ